MTESRPIISQLLRDISQMEQRRGTGIDSYDNELSRKIKSKKEAGELIAEYLELDIIPFLVEEALCVKNQALVLEKSDFLQAQVRTWRDRWEK